MEAPARRMKINLIQDQENVYANKKANIIVPSKRQGLSVRGALGEISTNIQLNREVNTGKVAVTAAEYEKKATLNRNAVNKSNYSHVQSKVDTGLAVRNVQPSSRPPLRREESTAGLAARAVVRTRAAFKDVQAKPNEIKESLTNLLQSKRTVEVKKTTKLPTLKETTKEKKSLPKPILKESTGKFGRLRISEKTDSCEKLQKDLLLDVTKVDTPKLPDDIEDIDAGDYNSPLLMSMYIKDIYHYLTQLEEKYPVEKDHLKAQAVITGKMRATLIDWLVEVQRQFKLVLETFHLTVGIIDRYLQAVPNVQRTQLQLVGVTAMFIASKYEEIYAPAVEDFVFITDNAYTKADIFQCEKDIIIKLGFCFARPIPLSFLRRFVKAARGTSKNHHLAKYFVDLCLVEYSMAHYHPSHLAASAICLSLYLLSEKSLTEVWTPTLSFYSGYSLERIEPVINQIAQIVVNVDKSKYKAVYNRYMDPTLAKVSTLPQLKGEAIFELANSESLS